MHITIQNLAKSFGGKDILADFSLELQSGVRLCVCGHNGSGKSTLLKLLAGKEAPDAGKILIPREARLGFVEQELDASKLQTELLHFVLEALPDWSTFWDEWEEAATAKDDIQIQRLSARQAELENKYGYNPEQRAKTVLSGLGFAEHKWHNRLEELSGGWRERAKLARVLTAGADILLLDEPTNHLDLEAVEWLESFLLDYQGILIFVAHDKVFMDKVGTHILFFSGGGKPLFRKGNFTQFIALQEEFSEQRAREAARLQDEIERKMDFVRRFKAKATKARQAASRQKMAKKLEKELEGLQPETKQRELSFQWPAPPQSDRTVLSVADLEFAFADGRKMWKSLSFNLYREQKIALVGPNGCGKSTLLRLLVGRYEKTAGNIIFGQLVKTGYFSQHQLDTLNPSGTVLGEIRRLSDPRTTEEELMSVLGLFLLGKNFFERGVGTLSGGEKSRLILATLFLARSNFLILDEPTNHLDLESREALIEALGNFPGTLLMVAHDRHLLTEVADQIWLLTEDGFIIYQNGFDEYNAARRLMRAQENAEALAAKRLEVKRTTGISRDEMKRLKREQAEMRRALYKEMKPFQDTYAQSEKELETTLEELAIIEGLLAEPETYADASKTTELLKQFHQLQEHSNQLLEQLEKLELRLKDFEDRKAELMDDDS